MEESTLWQSLPGGAGAWDGDADALAAELAKLGAGTVAAFEDELERCVALLETSEFAEAARRLAHDGTGIPIAGTALEFLRYAVIAAGRERFEAVLADPERIAGRWNIDIGESLEAVTEAALAMIDPESDDAPPAGSVVVPPSVRVNIGWGFGSGPDAADQYEQVPLDDSKSSELDLAADLENALRLAVASPGWVRTVGKIGFDHLWVMLEYWGPKWEAEGARAQRRRNEMQVIVTRDAARLPYVWDIDLLRSAAAAEVTAIVEVVGGVLHTRGQKASSTKK
jgi:hypothetical protein